MKTRFLVVLSIVFVLLLILDFELNSGKQANKDRTPPVGSPQEVQFISTLP
ncbi:hypothetical protein JOD43_003992 [Pullulanibacillus pueri]|uniref:Uncharacterized protein n=1 Tax=Pullulanibacillus pueri TaxID=1437324 RepID=A0A8J2ZZ40_9BACL|nr:hypothetical protein [Pullulanibacillus pueri]MBM7683811.1 hypothetical protein [Pullulanibacillus pueri]GGH87667.1 hypothetical protein GCM10007096_38210 [Pullulanibacillus pueri]